MVEASFNKAEAMQIYWNGILRSFCEFTAPSLGAMNSISEVEREKVLRTLPQDTYRDYLDLLRFNTEIGAKGLINSLTAMTSYPLARSGDALQANLVTLFGGDGEDVVSYTARERRLFDLVVNGFPKAILDVKSEYGLHLDNGGYIKIAETERFELYQVLPLDRAVEVNEKGKPVVIIPPYVLGPHILAFLPGEHKSFIHCFANQGIPTYIRIVKDIDTTPAVQVMTCEDDALDTRDFCEQVMARHGKPVTLTGFCQGGYIAALDILSGQLDGMADALITCVSPMDGSRSKSLVDYIEYLPARFRELGYAVKTLPNGNQVVDGKVMSWVYKLKSMDLEAPVVSFNRDLMMLERSLDKPVQINKTAAALNHWMTYDRTDLPLGITEMSFASYTRPVDKEGNLPVKLFGRQLNFKRMKEKGIQWLICIADKDDLIDAPAALAPLDYIEAEVSVFPKGHGAIATSWSLPTSECALHTYFCPANKQFGDKCRGPVHYHLDLDNVLPVASGTGQKDARA
ncbi:MAG: metal transporter [Syntrophobacteraceae bacterium]